MADFVSKGFLGRPQDFKNRCMQERTHVMGFVQRKGASVVGKELHNRFIQPFWLPNEQGFVTAKYRKSLFPTYHALAKVWNHPDLLFPGVKEDKEMLSDDSMDDMLFEDGISSDQGNTEASKDDWRFCARSNKKTESDGPLNLMENLDWSKDLINEEHKEFWRMVGR